MGSCPFLGRPRFRLGAACCSVSTVSLLLSISVALLVGMLASSPLVVSGTVVVSSDCD